MLAGYNPARCARPAAALGPAEAGGARRPVALCDAVRERRLVGALPLPIPSSYALSLLSIENKPCSRCCMYASLAGLGCSPLLTPRCMHAHVCLRG